MPSRVLFDVFYYSMNLTSKPNLDELRDDGIDENFPDETLMKISTNDDEEVPCYVEIYDKHGGSFIVNARRVKLYHDEEQLNELPSEEIHLMYEKGKMKGIVKGDILYVEEESSEEM
ncbi:hypothetical protein Tco_0635987 [Tanacetum coccineum]